jgi:hypothetical protein
VKDSCLSLTYCNYISYPSLLAASFHQRVMWASGILLGRGAIGHQA